MCRVVKIASAFFPFGCVSLLHIQGSNPEAVLSRGAPYTPTQTYESASECETETNLSRRAWSGASFVSRRRPLDLRRGLTECTIQLSATDVLAPTSMKNAAKCDTSCELQNPVNHQNFERILRFRDIPGSMLVGVSAHTPLTPRVGMGFLFSNTSRLNPPALRRWSLSVALDLACLHKQPFGSVPRRVDLRTSNGANSRLGPRLRIALPHCGCGKFPRGTPSPA